ncbi:unnamed protein product [Adineta steineri]|uniref:EGF-like domain-containing protein n=1 Tax=Adineta steineri TaxID=433720 RepID=A0A813Z6S6_9BILA|nr:unnamed protein product [Adineta steineri]
MVFFNNIISLIFGLSVLILQIQFGELAPSIKNAVLESSCINAVNPGYISSGCPVSPDGYNFGWHFVLPDISNAFVSINCQFSKAGTVTKMIAEPCAMHAYCYTPTADTLLGCTANVSGTDTKFTLSDVCMPPNPCLDNNGDCDINAACSQDQFTGVRLCTCKTGFTNTGTTSNVICTELYSNLNNDKFCLTT